MQKLLLGLRAIPARGLPSVYNRHLIRLLEVAVIAGILYFLFTLNSHLFPTGSPEPSMWSQETNHPINEYIRTAQLRWSAKLARQSKTLPEAVAEYKRRYKIDPPEGFDEWWRYARSVNAVLVDEYDEMMDTILPFVKLGHEEVRRRSALIEKFKQSANMLIVGGDPGRDKNGKMNDTARIDKGPRSNALITMLKPVMNILNERKWPEFKVPLAELAEPRVLRGEEWEEVSDALNGKKKDIADVGGLDVWDKHRPGDRSVLKSLKTACGRDSKFAKEIDNIKFEFTMAELEKRFIERAEDPNWKPKFLTNVAEDNDMCNRPELAQYHGIFRSWWNTTRGLYPLLTYGRPSAYGDILIPSSYQWYADPRYFFHQKDDVPWEKKTNHVYWLGEPSGGGKGDHWYGSMHRHRLVTMANPTQTRKVPISGVDATGNFTQILIDAPTANSLSNISLAELKPDQGFLFGSDLRDKKLIKFSKRQDFKSAWRTKILMDVDGWGASGRWRALLASSSLPLRSTIYHEWFSDRMEPWLHYVPVSVSMDELWDLMGYFLGTPDGRLKARDEEARFIATQGSAWVKKHMRKEDMTLYLLRLMMELNRAFNGPEWTYKG